jgi:heterodisulfide reductase subunit A-like polyferredoxin
MGPLAFLQQIVAYVLLHLYQLVQWFLDKLLSPTPPPPHAKLVRPKIAIIGAGLTGVAAASHCVGHGFDCRIFEAGSNKSLGGIWAVRFPVGHDIT